MKKLLIIAMGAMLFASCSATKQAADKATNNIEQYRYDVEYLKNSGDGMSTVKVWSYDKNASVAAEKCKSNAVHAVIFKGYSGQGAAQPALAKGATAYADHQDFFDKFFKSGEYLKYVTNVVDGSQETRNIKGGEKKVSSIVTVNVKALRSDLQSAGVIRGLSSGF